MAIDDNTSYELTGYQVKDLAQKIRAKADSASLASVATSGLYSDLTGAPTIPTVYNGTLTIQHNGATKGTFTANQSTASTVNIETIYADDYIDTTALAPIVSTSMIEDEAVTTAKIDDEAVTAAKTAFGGNYSTTEVNTGFTWINGKPIYKKTIHASNLTAGEKNINHDVSNMGLVIKNEAFGMIDATTTLQMPALSSTSGGNYAAIWTTYSTYIKLFLSVSLSDLYITIWYTKTTD